MTAADDALIAEAGRCTHDPLRWAKIAWQWGTPDLPEPGPRKWQADILDTIGHHLRTTPHKVLRIAVASGHGIGKSALVGMIDNWAMSTHVCARVVVTANTLGQLSTKTGPEIMKWHRESITSEWFTAFATSIQSKAKDPKGNPLAKSWCTDLVPWSAENTESFAGLHNAGKRIVLIFDEASSIHDKVWEVAEGAMTDPNTEIIWIAFGNPTRNTGKFRECFGRDARRWITKQIDSRTVEGASSEYDDWVTAYGEDSDFVRVRVRGIFPRAGSVQLISSELLREAATRPPGILADAADPVVIGVDVARFGDDENALFIRCGRDGRKWQMVTWRGLDLMQSSAMVAEVVEDLKRLGIPTAMVFVDQTGIGAGVVDRLRQMGYPVTGVDNGASSDWAVGDAPGHGEKVKNKAAEMWVRARLWLRTGGAIINDPTLIQQLESRQYGYNEHGEIILERKDDMKKRGLSSPDRADCFCLTFAYPVAMVGYAAGIGGSGSGMKSHYDPLAYLRR